MQGKKINRGLGVGLPGKQGPPGNGSQKSGGSSFDPLNPACAHVPRFLITLALYSCFYRVLSLQMGIFVGEVV